MTKKFLIIFGLAIFLIAGCSLKKNSQDKSDNQQNPPVNLNQELKPTIRFGTYGLVLLYEGNCFPVAEGQQSGCKVSPASTKVVFTKPVQPGYTESDLEIVMTITSDDQGFYQAELLAGNYQIFVEEKDTQYCEGKGLVGNLCPAGFFYSNQVNSTRLDLKIDHAVW